MKFAIFVGSGCPAAGCPIPDAGARSANTGRHVRRSALVVCPLTMALRAAPSRGGRSEVAGPELCHHRDDNHGEERQEGPLPRGLGPSRVGGRVSVGVQGPGRRYGVPIFCQGLGQVDPAGDSGGGHGDGRHRNRCLTAPGIGEHLDSEVARPRSLPFTANLCCAQ